MSEKTIKYEICLLAAANAGMITAVDSGTIGNPVLLADVELSNRLAFAALGQWEGANNKIIRWSKRRLEEWRDELAGAADNMTMGALVAASYQALVDLSEIVTGEKLLIVKAIIEPVARCSEFFHTKKSDEDVYTVACDVLQPLYDRIGFIP